MMRLWTKKYKQFYDFNVTKIYIQTKILYYKQLILAKQTIHIKYQLIPKQSFIYIYIPIKIYKIINSLLYRVNQPISIHQLNKFNKIKIKHLIIKINKHQQNNLTMNSLQSATHVLNLIVKQSKQKIYQNKVVKNMLSPYSSVNVQSTKHDIMMQTGVRNENSNREHLIHQIRSQKMPIHNQKDKFCFFSVKKFNQQKKHIDNSTLTIQNNIKKPKSINHYKNNRKYKRNTVQNVEFNSFQQTKKQTNKNQQSKESLFFKIQQSKPVVIPKFMLKQEIHINHLRQMKNNQFAMNQLQTQRGANQSKMSTERQMKLKSYLQNHISRQNNGHTYDIEGNLLLFSHQNNKKAIQKAYPPTIRYQVQNQQNFQQFKGRNGRRNKKSYQNRSVNQFSKRKQQHMNHHIRGAKGQIFKSSVLKTINLSKISLGNPQQTQYQFMKRNDLFNNNHCRQTTSIPFMKMEQGSFFKQLSTNQRIGKIDAQTEADSKQQGNKTSNEWSKRSGVKSHECRTRSQFRKYNSRRQTINLSDDYHKDKKTYPLSSKNSKNLHQFGDSRYSTFYFKRPHTTDVGRIKRENESLFNSMLEQ